MKKIKQLKCYLLAGSLCMMFAVSSIEASAVVCYGETTEQKTSEEADEKEAEEESIVEIDSAKALVELAENCKYDNWSVGRTIKLTEDIDLAGADFEGIAYFNGVFEGNGHTISNINMEPKGSNYGFFRYIGDLGVVKNLNVSGNVLSSGSRENIGGIAGVNYGTILKCSFKGSVSGENAVGAVAGCNKPAGSIINCQSTGIVLATNYTGGIAGKNEGLVSDCTSNTSINVEELETVLDLGGVDLGKLNLTQNVVNRNDMGGIAGSSTGVISNCKNYGTVGFEHTGYNVGGIAGSQSGIVLLCINEGKIYGRKDVGGIVGQAEPYIESEYLEDKVNETRDDINRLNRTLSGISTTISNTSAEARKYADNLSEQYSQSLDNISGSLDTLTDSISADHPEAQTYADNINQALDEIHSIGSTDEKLTEEQIDSIQDNLGIINDNLGNLQGSYSSSGESTEDFMNSLSDELKNDGRRQEMENLADTVDNGLQSISNSISSAVNQANHISDSVSDDLAVLTGEEEIIKDISSIETAETTDGVISGCTNRGVISGDLNVGGIAGTMNVEYEEDPEFDTDLTESSNIAIRSTVNNVVIHSINYGRVTGKKNCVGGITGLQELGLIYDCEGYGKVASDSGNYLGGIVGKSAASIQKNYSFCEVVGNDYVGGICGNGYTVTESISACQIESEGERVGSIAGFLEEEGSVKNNYFFSDSYDGIDNISYAGAADRVSYEEIVAMEGIPRGFSRITITFESEDGIISTKNIPYGGDITEEDMPSMPEREGYYVRWQESGSKENITENRTFTAEYIPWTESVAGKEKAENGKNLFLAIGEFYDDTTLQMEVTEGPEEISEEAQVIYAYDWKLESEKEMDHSSIEGHFYVPGEMEEAQIWLKQNGIWKQVESKEDGSYLVAEVPTGAAIALVMEPEKPNYYLLAAEAAGGILLIILVIVIRIRKKKKKQKKSEENA